MLNAKPQLSASIRVRPARPKTELIVRIEHIYTVRIWEDARRLKLLFEDIVHNLVTTEGENKYLDATLKTGLTSPAWYIGLVDNDGFTAYAVGDTAAKIATTANPPTTNGWQELTAYTEATRQVWTPGSISAASVDNSGSPAAFTINATKVVRGAFLDSTNTKGGTSGVLLGEADFSAPQSVIAGNIVDVIAACSFTTC